jgi:hypothetical protein
MLIAGTECLSQSIKADQETDRVDILIDGRLFTSYRYPSDWKFPYLWPVNGPATGNSLTIEQGIRYPHHRSLYFGCDKVGGGNFWQGPLETGRIISLGPVAVETATAVVIEDTCEWVQPGLAPIIRDRRQIIITAPDPGQRRIEFRIELTFLVDTHVGKSNHSLFAAEMVPELAVEGGGNLINSNGKTSEEGTFGDVALWCDGWGEREGVREGLAILQHPENPESPWPFFTRDYGFFSPTPLFWVGEEGLDFEAGDTIALKFLVVAHKGSAEEANLDHVLKEWVDQN